MAKKKLFVLEFDKGVDEDFKNWTKEAVQEFIDLFPEYKDNFQINEGKSYYTKAEVEKIIARSSGVPSDSVWAIFEQQSDGSYLRKESLDWSIRQALENGRVNTSTLLDVRHKENSFPPDEPVLVSIISKPAHLGYGISNQRDMCVSAAACGKNKEYFKDIVMHELGHVFRATHKNRRNVVKNLGEHCTDADCLMYEYAYTGEAFNRRHHKKKPIFCIDCMDSMRDYMENTLHLVRQGQKNLSVTNDNSENLPQPTSDIDRAFKADIRALFKTSAEKEGSVYKENIQSLTYSATITHKDGLVDHINAANEQEINLSAKTKDGKPTTPSTKRFADIAAYAHSKDMAVNFGDIKTSDFKAKLMLACLTHEPPVKMTNAPKVTEEFLNSIKDEKLRQTLKDKTPKLQTQNSDSPQKQAPENQPQPQPQIKGRNNGR